MACKAEPVFSLGNNNITNFFCFTNEVLESVIILKTIYFLPFLRCQFFSFGNICRKICSIPFLIRIISASNDISFLLPETGSISLDWNFAYDVNIGLYLVK